MDKEKIILRVNKNGLATVEVQGVKGDECKDITANLEKALGTVVETKPTDEMYEVKDEQQIQDASFA